MVPGRLISDECMIRKWIRKILDQRFRQSHTYPLVVVFVMVTETLIRDE